MQIIKTFDYKGVELRIIQRKAPYLNSYISVREVIAPNEGTIPYTIGHREILKNIIKNVTTLLDDYDKYGVDFFKELIGDF